MTFDTTKNYAEFGNAFFRGKLNGANGEARFKLTVDTLTAVDTININGGQITYSFFFRHQGLNVTLGQPMLSGVVDIIDENVYMEFLAFGHLAETFVLDGVARPRYNVHHPSKRSLPFNEVQPMALGQHTVQLVAGATGFSSDAYIMCRYIRRTGLDNL